MATVPVQTNGGSTAVLNERLHDVQRQLLAERRRATRATTLVVIVGILALVALGGYFAYGYSEIKKNTTQDILLNFAEGKVRDQLPIARQTVADEIKKSAPEWARMLSQQAQENLPTARQKLEEHALEQCDGMLKEASLMSTEQFRRFLRDNRQTLETGFKDLAKSPKVADQTLTDIEKSLDKELQTSMRGQARELLSTLHSANAKLTRLRDSPRLTAEEHMERRIIMLARRLELQQLSPELANKPVPAKPPKEPGLEPESVPSTKPVLSEDQIKKMKAAMGAQRKNAPPAPPKADDASAKKGTPAPAKDKATKDKEASEKKP